MSTPDEHPTLVEDDLDEPTPNDGGRFLSAYAEGDAVGMAHMLQRFDVEELLGSVAEYATCNLPPAAGVKLERRCRRPQS